MQDCPNINLQLRLYTYDPEQTDQIADAFITAQPARPGFWSMRLMEEMLIAVHAPDYDLAEKSHLRLITTDLEDRHLGAEWVAYCKLTGMPLEDLHTGEWMQCTHYLLALEMATNRLGIALVPDFLAARDLEKGGWLHCRRRCCRRSARITCGSSRPVGKSSNWYS